MLITLVWLFWKFLYFDYFSALITNAFKNIAKRVKLFVWWILPPLTFHTIFTLHHINGFDGVGSSLGYSANMSGNWLRNSSSKLCWFLELSNALSARELCFWQTISQTLSLLNGFVFINVICSFVRKQITKKSSHKFSLINYPSWIILQQSARFPNNCKLPTLLSNTEHAIESSGFI